MKWFEAKVKKQNKQKTTTMFDILINFVIIHSKTSRISVSIIPWGFKIKALNFVNGKGLFLHEQRLEFLVKQTPIP